MFPFQIVEVKNIPTIFQIMTALNFLKNTIPKQSTNVFLLTCTKVYFYIPSDIV